MRDDHVGHQEHGTQAGTRGRLLGPKWTLEHQGRKGYDGDKQRQCRCESKKTPPVETREADSPCICLLSHQHGCDDKAGDHKEHIDSDETSRNGQSRMERNNQPHRECTQPLDIGAMRKTLPRRNHGSSRGPVQHGHARRLSPDTTRTTPPTTTVSPMATERLNGSPRMRNPSRTATPGFT